MEDWKLFGDARFSLQFKYPSLAPDAEPVETVETQQGGMLRLHVLAPKSREVYFEVCKYDALSAKAEYQRHKEYLLKQFDSLVISELDETMLASLPGYEYTFRWDQGERIVLLVERGSTTYRIIYDPRFPVNLQILSTLEWLNLP
jgi:hypothetical protein